MKKKKITYNIKRFVLAAFVLGSMGACLDDSFHQGVGAPPKLNVTQLVYDSATGFCLSYIETLPNQVLQARCSGGTEQQVVFSKVEGMDDLYNIRSAVNQKCLQVSNGSAGDGAPLEFALCNGKQEQHVRLLNSNLDVLYRKIQFVSSGKCVDIERQERANGAAIVQWACHRGPSQDFLIDDAKINTQIPKILWTFWDKGKANLDPFYLANVKHWQNVLPDWEIRVVNIIPGDEYFYGNYFDPNAIPTVDYLKSKIFSNPRRSTDLSVLNQELQGFEEKLNPFVVFSDFVRLELLYKHGGVWLDPSVMLHYDLTAVKASLESIGDFKISGYTTRGQATYSLRYADSLENFFIAALPQSEIIAVWKANFRKYWDLKVPHMRIQDNPLYNGSMGIKLNVGLFSELADYLNQHVALKYTLITNPNLLKDIFILGGTGADEKGPFTLLQIFNWKDRPLLTLKEGAQMDSVMGKMDNVVMSKFPSPNSLNIRRKTNGVSDYPFDFFFDSSNLFGKLNQEYLTVPLNMPYTVADKF